jgi:hypothetical protein
MLAVAEQLGRNLVSKSAKSANNLAIVSAVGCNLNRPVASAFEKAGLRLPKVDHYCLGGVPRSVGYLCRGVAMSTG